MAIEINKPTYRIVNYDAEDDDLKSFSQIDEATKEWLKNCEHIWKFWKKCDRIKTTLIEYFESAPNPYLSTLRIIVNISDFKQIKPKSSVAFTVIEEFTKWLEPRKSSYKYLLDVNLKIAAFRLVNKQRNMEFIQLVADTYDFLEHKEKFIDLIKNMIVKKQFKEAAQCATMLKLQKHYQDIEVLLLPLILQNKLSIVEQFIADEPEIQKSLIQYLDNLITSDSNMNSQLNKIIEEYNIPDIKISTTEIKPMTKLIVRFVKLYNLPSEICQNVNKKRSTGALRFLIYKRYTDYSLSLESWREMALETVGNDTNLQQELIRMLINVRDAREGLYWTKMFKIPIQQWPSEILYEAKHMKSEGASTSKGEAYDWEVTDESANYYELHLPRDSICVVDNSQKFEEFLDNGLKGVSVVGIDLEWKPTFGTKQTELALIQIATHNKVYILDVTTMANESRGLWAELALILFVDTNILKLGFGIAQDMAMIRDSLPVFSNMKTHGPGYIDIVHLWQKLVDEYKFVFPHEYDTPLLKNNLSKLVELCFGQKLNKSNQFSNWEQRPLRESQIVYAALDAYCLLEVYEVMKTHCTRLDIPFTNICLEIQHIPQKTPKTSQSTKKSTHEPRIPASEHQNLQQKHHSTKPELHLMKINNPNNIHQDWSQMCKKRIQIHMWRVVCDLQLSGLASKLRMCGCDCIRLPIIKAVDVSKQQNRVLLTNKHYLKFSQYFMPGQFYFVRNDFPNKQLRQVLNHFGISVTQRHIFSRCKVCNCNEFAKVPRFEMDQIIERYYRDKPGSYQINKKNHFGASNLNNNTYNYEQIEDRRWILNQNSINVKEFSTKYHVEIKIDQLPIEDLKNEEWLYICEKCGKVYCLGSTFEDTLNHYHDLLKV
nr:exonuclease mut-7 homolog isoform X2 [Nomia melanderi]